MSGGFGRRRKSVAYSVLQINVVAKATSVGIIATRGVGIGIFSIRSNFSHKAANIEEFTSLGILNILTDVPGDTSRHDFGL